MHLFVVADCRTPDCGTVHVLKYLGEKDSIPGIVPISVPVPLWIRCQKCELSHDFSSAHLRQIEQEEAPPFDFRDTI